MKHQYSYIVVSARVRAEMIAEIIHGINEVWEGAPKAVVTAHPSGWSVGPEGKHSKPPKHYKDITCFAQAADMIIATSEASKKRHRGESAKADRKMKG